MNRAPMWLRLSWVLLVLLIPKTALAGDVSGALAFVPQDAYAVVGAHVDKLRRSPHFQKLLVNVLEGEAEQLAELKKQTGLDLKKDVRAVVVGVRSLPRDNTNAVVIAEAQVDEARLVAFFRSRRGKVETVPAPGGKLHRSDGTALAVRGSFVIIGDEPAVRAALAKKGASRELTQLLTGITQRDIFFAARPTAKQRNELAREKPELREVRSLRGAADLGSDLAADAVLELDTPEAATRLEQQAQAALALARIAASQDNPGLDELLRSFSLTTSGREIHARLKLSEQQLRTVLQSL